MGRILEDPDYYVWCCSPIDGPDGKIHVFFSRWPKETDFEGWLYACEVAHAVADYVEGPYVVVDVALKGRGSNCWDAMTIHNPTIHKVGNIFALFYFGNAHPGIMMSELANEKIRKGRELDEQPGESTEVEANDYRFFITKMLETSCIGLAVSDSLYGPWKRISDEAPILKPGMGEKDWDNLSVTNPAFLMHPDGQFWLYYNGLDRETFASNSFGNRRLGLAIADKLEGPYRKYDGNPVIDLASNNAQLEDSYIFASDEKIIQIARDMGYFNHEYGLYFESGDGITWSSPMIAYKNINDYMNDPISGSYRCGRIERPQVLIRNGKPAYIFGALIGGKYGMSTSVVLKFND